MTPVLIPAYQPGEALPALIAELRRLSDNPILVVDDGSTPDCAKYFALPDGVHLLRHPVNLGKGAALKTGLAYALEHFPGAAGVVTADADGQHSPEDILRVGARLAAAPDSLVMGVRGFAGDVPLRSRIGNRLTRVLMKLLTGQRLTDTQSGLRGIPQSLIPHLLALRSTGYEFELDMLLTCKHQRVPIAEEPIRTIYLDGNQGSHFHPIFDSMRIYFLLLRFSLLSLATALLDNSVFVLALGITGSIGESQLTARLVAMTFNYLGARRLVFQSHQRHAVVLPKYAALVAVNGLASYAMIRLLHDRLGIRTVAAKLIAEGLLFLANFAIQRDFVFTRRKRAAATDWDAYYTNVAPTAKLTRRYTRKVLVDAIRRYTTPGSRLAILEIGGANSCFLDAIVAGVACERYEVVDTNRYGLSLLERRVTGNPRVHLRQASVLNLALEREADVVFSVGLVEHFTPEQTREAVHAHLDALRPGGTAIITFPTPTLLYRATRAVIELAGLWQFPDERPLMPGEVLAAFEGRADVLFQKTLWPLILTQHLIVARKRHS